MKLERLDPGGPPAAPVVIITGGISWGKKMYNLKCEIQAPFNHRKNCLAARCEYLQLFRKKGREGKGREGKGREGKGREGKGREGKGREGKGRAKQRRNYV